MSLLPPRIDLEMTQALLRMAVIATSILYALIAYGMGEMSENKLFVILAYCMGFGVVTVGLIIRIAQRPGASGRRRLFALVTDNLAGIVTISVGGEAMLPVYSVMLSMTVGYGMRYGRNYLLLATGFSMISLMTIIVLTPFLREHHAVAVMMILTMLVLPLFVYFLLGRLHMALEETQAANQAKSRFLAQASHDLRQPIHSISLFTACLRDAALGDNEQRLVNNIDRALSAVEQLFRSLLDIYTLNQGEVAPRPESVDLDALLNGLAAQNSEAATWAGVDIRVHSGNHHVWTDPALLRTLLQNLVSNAFKYAPGKPILIGCRRQKGTVSIGVYDRGRGIPAEHLPHLCNEFYRVREKRDRDIEGVGLGLSIVSRIARLMNLRVNISSVPERGTAVTVSGLKAVAASQPVNNIEINWNTRLLSGLRVMLIEDNRNVLEATAMLLRRWGCEVQTFSSIPEISVDCDLVVTDFDLDRTASGADCIAYLSGLQGRRIPAIVITGHELQHVRQTLNDPDIPVLSKPVRPVELRSLLLSFKAGSAVY
ncbi:hybrid sensor histidine kinase/response regulator [Pseudomonas amygdali pv. morsprunorum]|uniref:histidine kinase n=2 Tax=Pseudomonas syringae group TaxID=136849 RepID=A0A2K4WQ94_PSESX|nr:hybrid sensor histidine kinase/response regulator [Pseudomonas amygdali pv. morsprunorum]SOS37994.1 sensor histidine kinase [Pseudomonas syringae]POP95689.1 hybrid sensor histidine kinase/response regulator [Pseudomonas amygdali pv. morsprunorum]POY78773.1 hybrid sensor histidine kinase/response regulator [Pseudomonas amygdali pv. morsprunorum]RMO13864.1 Sensor histidine kinase/response regulator [Pseudomonas amygdali pv. morsprunorum]